MAEQVAPTRMNLLARKAQIKLASDGVQLLEGKREALLKELITRARELRNLRKDLHLLGRQALASIAIARAMRGTPELRSTGVAGRRELQVTVNTEKVWGLHLGNIEQANVVRNPADRGIGLRDVSAHVIEAGENSERMLEQLLVCAPKELNLQLIGEEVRKVSRRINALNEYLLPMLREDVRAISRVLDEREREDTFRLKRIKKKAADKKKLKLEAERAQSS
ncbi:MAG: V-type ATP synthase subunit D [Candidatus Hydrogenedentes bacterium]|nr:V-type ATP synthase subunit D [Candidatus Hydrogenedentota bacterium]